MRIALSLFYFLHFCIKLYFIFAIAGHESGERSASEATVPTTIEQQKLLK